MKKEMNNDVLINRSILGWEWYKDVNVYKLFTHLIYRANYEDDMHRGVLVKRGQVYTGLERLSYETGLSVQQTKTALKKLHSSNEITSKSTNKYRLITVCKYDTYQLSNKQDNKQTTPTATNKDTIEITAYKEVLKELEQLKELKELIEKQEKEILALKSKPKRTQFKKPNIEELNSYAKEMDYKFDAQRFYDYYESNGWKVGRGKMQDWKASVRGWVSRNKDYQKQDENIPSKYEPDWVKEMQEQL